tara:strand:+ start:269 stop:508 length:240 start_codon:yes stop_codon:yes gene_type:complete
MAQLIKTDGSIVNDVAVETLQQQQQLVDGYVQYVYKEDRVFIVNEEGILRSMDFNAKASEMSGRPLVGDVVFAYKSELK